MLDWADAGHLDQHAAQPSSAPRTLEGITATQLRRARLTSEPYMPLMMTALCVPSAGCRWMQEVVRGGPASTKKRSDEAAGA